MDSSFFPTGKVIVPSSGNSLADRWAPVLVEVAIASLASGCYRRSEPWHEVWFDGGQLSLNAVWGTDGQVWAVGSSGTVVHHDGRAWSTVQAPTTKELNDVHGCSSTDVWAVGDSGVVLHFDGTSWKQAPVGAVMDLGAVWCGGKADVWTGGREGYIYHYDGSGWDETEIAKIPPVHIVDIWSGGDGRYWFAGESSGGSSGLVLRHDKGQWLEYPVPNHAPRAAAGRPGDDDPELWLAGEDTVVTRSYFSGPGPWRIAYAASDSHFFALVVDDDLGLRVVSGRTTAIETADGWEEHPELHTEGLHRGSDIRTVNGLWTSGSASDPDVILVGAEHYLGGVNPMGDCPHCTGGFILAWDVRGE